MIQYLQEFEEILNKYGIKKSEVCIVGSSVMANEGFRTNHDLDFAVTPDARERLLEKYEKDLNVIPGSGTICFTSEVQILKNRYGIIGIKDEDLFTDQFSRPFMDVRIAVVEVELAKKIVRYLKKDEIDLPVIGASEKAERYDWGEVARLAYHCRVVKPVKLYRRIGSKVKQRLKAFINRPEKYNEIQDGRIISAIEPSYLLESCYRNSRYDILACLLILKGDLTAKEEELFIKKYSINKDALWKTTNQIKSIGIPMIKVDHKLNLNGKGYDLAAALFLNKELCVLHYTDPVDSIVVAQDRNFPLKTISLLREYGVLFCGIIWGSVEEYFDQIEIEIGSRYKIYETKVLDLGERLSDFISDVYAIDDIAKWKVKIKQSFLRNYSGTIKIVIFEITDPKFRIGKRTGWPISGTGAELKDLIRRTYKGKINDYVYDIIFHTGDNHRTNRSLLEIVSRYE